MTGILITDKDTYYIIFGEMKLSIKDLITTLETLGLIRCKIPYPLYVNDVDVGKITCYDMYKYIIAGGKEPTRPFYIRRLDENPSCLCYIKESLKFNLINYEIVIDDTNGCNFSDEVIKCLIDNKLANKFVITYKPNIINIIHKLAKYKLIIEIRF